MEAEELYRRGREALKRRETLSALGLFERAYNKAPDIPKYQSFLGLCIAYERGRLSEAVELCKRAIEAEPDVSEHYLNLGKVYLGRGLRNEALEVFRKGMRIDNKNSEIIAELQAMGVRIKPVFHFLPRDHFLNKYLGIILTRLGLR